MLLQVTLNSAQTLLNDEKTSNEINLAKQGINAGKDERSARN